MFKQSIRIQNPAILDKEINEKLKDVCLFRAARKSNISLVQVQRGQTSAKRKNEAGRQA